MFLLGDTQWMLHVDELANEGEDFLLCVSVETRGLDWLTLAFFICRKSFIRCTRLRCLHCHTASNLLAGLAVGEAVGMTVRAHRLHVPDGVPSEHHLSKCSKRMFQAGNKIWIRD